MPQLIKYSCNELHEKRNSFDSHRRDPHGRKRRLNAVILSCVVCNFLFLRYYRNDFFQHLLLRKRSFCSGLVFRKVSGSNPSVGIVFLGKSKKCFLLEFSRKSDLCFSVTRELVFSDNIWAEKLTSFRCNSIEKNKILTLASQKLKKHAKRYQSRLVVIIEPIRCRTTPFFIQWTSHLNVLHCLRRIFGKNFVSVSGLGILAVGKFGKMPIFLIRFDLPARSCSLLQVYFLLHQGRKRKFNFLNELCDWSFFQLVWNHSLDLSNEGLNRKRCLGWRTILRKSLELFRGWSFY